ncbi:MAG: hypothetical protein EXX96DRAFT_544979 [Benjaminiella poitrasii]|nr:MAG: hypothetical protein EXX96DRAFT_544979 [Benjaminiella poitrasii]
MLKMSIALNALSIFYLLIYLFSIPFSLNENERSVFFNCSMYRHSVVTCTYLSHDLKSERIFLYMLFDLFFSPCSVW